MSLSPAYQETHRKVAAARERRLVDLVAENKRLRRALRTARDWMQCDEEFGDPEGFKFDIAVVDEVLAEMPA